MEICFNTSKYRIARRIMAKSPAIYMNCSLKSNYNLKSMSVVIYYIFYLKHILFLTTQQEELQGIQKYGCLKKTITLTAHNSLQV